MAYINVAEWSAENVADWLKGLEDCILPYVNFFLNNNVNGCRLLLLTSDDLVNLNVLKKGHQEIILEGVDLLKQLHYNFSTETLQSQALKLGCKSRSLYNQLKQDEEERRAAEAAAVAAAAAAPMHEKPVKVKGQQVMDAKKEVAKKVDRVSTATLVSVSEIVLAVKQFISWIDRYPFSSQDMYLPIRRTILSHSIELASTAQRDQFVEQPNLVIRAASLSLADLCDRIVQDVNDSLAISPASLEVVAIKKLANEDLGLQVYSSFNNSGIHIVGWIKRGSPSDRCSRIEEGDEIVQIRYQTVVGWLQSKLVNAMKESPTQVLLTLKKRPRHHPVPGRFEVIKAQKLPVPRRPHAKTHSTRRTTATVTPAAVAAAASSSAASHAKADADSDDEGFETSYKQTQLKGPVFPGYRKPRHPVRRRATISGSTPAGAHVAIRVDDLVPNSVKGATSASPINQSGTGNESLNQHPHEAGTAGSAANLSRNRQETGRGRGEQVLARSISHDVSPCRASGSQTTKQQQQPTQQREEYAILSSGRDSFRTKESLPSGNKTAASTSGTISSRENKATTVPTVVVQQPSPDKAVSDGYMSGSVPSSSRSPSSSSSSPSTSSQMSAGSSDLLPTIEKMGALSIDRSKQYKELVGFNLAALRCKQRGPHSKTHPSTLNSCNSVDSDENSAHSAHSDDIFSDSAFKQMQPKGPTPPPYRRPQVPRRRATISGASPTDLPLTSSATGGKNKSTGSADKSDTDSGKGPSTTPPSSTIPSPTVRGILSSTLTRIQESVSRARDQQLGRSNSHASASSASSANPHLDLHSLDYLFQSPTGRKAAGVPWITDPAATNKTLFAVSRNSTSPPEKNSLPSVTGPAPLVLSSFRPASSSSPCSSLASGCNLPRAKVIPLPPSEKPPPPPPIPDVIAKERETIPKSVIYKEEQQSQRKEFQLKDPFRDPFREPQQTELHYVDVDVYPEETEKRIPPARPTIYHQLLHGSSTPLSTRPIHNVGVVIPSHSHVTASSSSTVPADTSKPSFPAVISCQLKDPPGKPLPKTPARHHPDVPPPLPLRSVNLLPAPKITPRASLLKKSPAPTPFNSPEAVLGQEMDGKDV